MKQELVDHMLSLYPAPALDADGKWVFLTNPKTAQKSMMLEVMADRLVTHRRNPRRFRTLWNEVIAPKLDDIVIFTFVRNPWDKAVSAYHFLQQYRKEYLGYTFHDIVKGKLAACATDLNVHFRRQSPTFMFRGERIPNVFVGRFERLHEDWAIVADMVGATRELPHRNKSRHKPYVEYYDDECVKIVADFYAEEIRELGYEFGK